VGGQTLRRGRAGVAAIPKRVRRPKRAAAGSNLESAVVATGCGSSSQPSGLAFSRRPRTADNGAGRAVAVHVGCSCTGRGAVASALGDEAACLAQREHSAVSECTSHLRALAGGRTTGPNRSECTTAKLTSPTSCRPLRGPWRSHYERARPSPLPQRPFDRRERCWPATCIVLDTGAAHRGARVDDK
jgi:hypothetical protein